MIAGAHMFFWKGKQLLLDQSFPLKKMFSLSFLFNPSRKILIIFADNIGSKLLEADMSTPNIRNAGDNFL